MINGETIHNAGDVDIVDVTIVTSNGFAQPITPQVIGIEIYEDIFANFITGKVMIKDSQELTNLFPLIGEEVVRIHVHTPTLDDKEDFNNEFFIYKLDDRFKVKDRELIYVLHFISKEAIVDLNRKVSRGFKGNIADIVTQVCKQELQTTKPLDIEPTKNSTRFIANFWNPIRCIQWVTDQAVNAVDSPSYLFFENNYGFHFRSLTSLYQGTPIKQRFIWDNYTSDVDNSQGAGGTSYRSIDKDYQRILEIDMQNGWNYIDRLKSGMYGSQIIYYDMFTQQYVHKGYAPKWDPSKSLNPYPLWTDKVISNTRAVLIHDHQYQGAFDDYGDVSNTKIRQQRRSVLAQAEGYKLTINVIGRCDYHAGQRVYVEVPLNKQLTKDDPEYLDKLMSGNYLIAAICHFINREKHECTIELVKDSYMRELK
jgi:Fe-S-cluster containining protein